jgi:DNA-binding CsgD family transcriptional regulator
MKPTTLPWCGDSSTRAALREIAMRADGESAHFAGETTHRRLALWNGLLAGRWVVVDRFETDGRRCFLLAEPAGEEGVFASLGAQERRLVTLVAAGFSDKAMAVTLGIAPSTLSGVLRRAVAKMGLRSRVELVRLLRVLAA